MEDVNESHVFEFVDLWERRAELPRMSFLGMPSYIFARSLSLLAVAPLGSFVTISTITLSSFLLCGYLLAVFNIQNLLMRAGGEMEITVYLRKDVGAEAKEKLVGWLSGHKQVREQRFISKEDALAILTKDLGEDSAFIAEFAHDNPLPESIDVSLYPDELGLDFRAKTIEEIKAQEGVDDVVTGKQFVDRLRELLRVMKWLGFVGGMVVFGVVVALVVSTIKLAVFARRRELEIMKLLGATDTFVRIPFLVAGGIQGIAGGLLCLILLKASFNLIERELRSSSVFGVAIPNLSFIPPYGVLLLLLVSLLLGSVASRFAVSEYLKV